MKRGRLNKTTFVIFYIGEANVYIVQKMIAQKIYERLTISTLFFVFTDFSTHTHIYKKYSEWFVHE